MKNNKKLGKTPEKKFLKDSPPSYMQHPKGSIENSVDLNKQMGGALNYNPQVGFFKPTEIGNPDQVDFLKTDVMYNINWQFRCNGRPGSRP